MPIRTINPVLKNMAIGLVTAVCIVLIACNGKSTKPKAGAGYSFPTPTGWQEEKIPFPIEFATQIPYKGLEILRFPPGWAFPTSDEHWTYSFVWWLDGRPDINEKNLQENMTMYYTGLIGRNITEKKIPANKVTPISVTIQKIETDSDDKETYGGKITITDYNDSTFRALDLNCRIHKRECGSHTAVIFQISPQPAGHAVWKSLNDLLKGFSCEN